MRKRGTTLIESVIAIFIISVVAVTFLEALNVSITGTLELNRKTSALDLAKSQMEYIKTQTYNASIGNLSSVYPILNSGNISNFVNYNISGQVSNVSASQPLQKITINVSYLNGKQVQLTGYTTAETTNVSSLQTKGLIVTDVVQDIPYLPPGGKTGSCSRHWYDWWHHPDTRSCEGGTYMGYYQIIHTGNKGYISATWTFNWVNEMYGKYHEDAEYSWGAPYIGIYQGIPAWVNNDSQDNVEPDGIIFRGISDYAYYRTLDCLHGYSSDSFTGGCMPGCHCKISISSDYAPIIMQPNGCCQNSSDANWFFEIAGYYSDTPTGSFYFSIKTPNTVNASTYTVLFFNGMDRVSIDTTSASVTYIH